MIAYYICLAKKKYIKHAQCTSGNPRQNQVMLHQHLSRSCMSPNTPNVLRGCASVRGICADIAKYGKKLLKDGCSV